MALGLSLGFSALSHPSEHMVLYTNGRSVKEVKRETKGGEIAGSDDEENTLLVFGVRI
jgi:hypothetical protein